MDGWMDGVSPVTISLLFRYYFVALLFITISQRYYLLRYSDYMHSNCMYIDPMHLQTLDLSRIKLQIGSNIIFKKSPSQKFIGTFYQVGEAKNKAEHPSREEIRVYLCSDLFSARAPFSNSLLLHLHLQGHLTESKVTKISRSIYRDIDRDIRTLCRYPVLIP